MSRFINPVPQFRPNSKLYFFDSGTNTAKVTFKDASEKIPNTNPVLTDSRGNTPNVFYTGSAKLVVLDENSIQYIERDPVGGDNLKGEFSVWSQTTNYDINNIALGSDGEYYISIQSGNEGNDPTLNAPFWSVIRFIEMYNENHTYKKGFVVQTLNGNLWKSEKSDNLGNNPEDRDLSNWSASVDFTGATTSVLINSTASPATGDIVNTSGFLSAGDGGNAQWIATGNTITASQAPAQTGAATCSNANGDEFSLVVNSSINLLSLGFSTAETADNNKLIMNAAIVSAKATYGIVYIPVGNFPIIGPIDIEDIQIQGAEIGANDAPFAQDGSVLSIVDTVNSLFILHRGANIKGINFFYPDQVNTLSTPIVYPATIDGVQTTVIHNAKIDSCTFINSYQCIRLGGAAFALGRIFITDVQAYPVYNFLEVENALDVIQIDNFILSPGIFVAGATDLAGWTQNNGVAFIGKLDVVSILASDGLIYGMRYGFSVQNAAQISLCSFSNVDFDGVMVPFISTGTSRVTNLDFDSCEFLSNNRFDDSVVEDAQIRITGTAGDGTLSFNNCVFQSARKDCILIDGDALDNAIITGCEFKFWGAASGISGTYNAIAISTTGVNCTITGNTFLNNYTTGDGNGFQLSNANAVTMTGNLFKNCAVPIRQSIGTIDKLMLSGNTTTGTTGSKSLQIFTTVTNINAFDNLFDKHSDSPINIIGSGTPESVESAVIGSSFRRTDGGAGTSFYIKESGTGSTGWVAK